MEISEKLFLLKTRGNGLALWRNALVIVQLVCARQDRVALFSFDLHLDGARRVEGLSFYEFAPGTLAKSGVSSLGQSICFIYNLRPHEPGLT